MKESNELKMSADILADQLSALDLSDVFDILRKKHNFKEEDRMARANEAERFYRSQFEEELKIIIQKQLEKIAEKATSDLQLQFSRGVIYGLALIDEWFRTQVRVASPEKKDSVPEDHIPTGLE